MNCYTLMIELVDCYEINQNKYIFLHKSTFVCSFWTACSIDFKKMMLDLYVQRNDRHIFFHGVAYPVALQNIFHWNMFVYIDSTKLSSWIIRTTNNQCRCVIIGMSKYQIWLTKRFLLLDPDISTSVFIKDL